MQSLKFIFFSPLFLRSYVVLYAKVTESHLRFDDVLYLLYLPVPAFTIEVRVKLVFVQRVPLPTILRGLRSFLNESFSLYADNRIIKASSLTILPALCSEVVPKRVLSHVYVCRLLRGLVVDVKMARFYSRVILFILRVCVEISTEGVN